MTKTSALHKDLRTPKYRMRVEDDLRLKESYERTMKYKPDYEALFEGEEDEALAEMYG
jgi:stalled ribosome alternative rescue factor ArfA